MDCVEVFCPATIANISCGFDVLGLCLEQVGDVIKVRRKSAPGIRITVHGANLPENPKENAAGVATQAFIDRVGTDIGFEIEIYKKIKPGSGIGSSAASSAGAVFAVNHLLGGLFSSLDLVGLAMKGEAVCCGSEHADNVAPALMGGFTLVRDTDPPDIISLPTPKELYASIIHPEIEIRTADARAILKKNIPLKKAVIQWANLAAFVSAIHTEDYELMSRSMEDVIIEPERSDLIPYYHQTKQFALDAGAIGGGISGSGPSVFALSQGRDTAQKVLDAMAGSYRKQSVNYDAHLSKIATKGAYVLSES